MDRQRQQHQQPSAPSTALPASPDTPRKGLHPDLKKIVEVIIRDMDDLEIICEVLEAHRYRNVQTVLLVAEVEGTASVVAKLVGWLVENNKIKAIEASALNALLGAVFKAVIGTNSLPLPSDPSITSAAGSNKRARTESSSSSPSSSAGRLFPEKQLARLNIAHAHFWEYLAKCALLTFHDHPSTITCMCNKIEKVSQGFNFFKHMKTCAQARGLVIADDDNVLPTLPPQAPSQVVVTDLLRLPPEALRKIPAIFLARLPSEAIAQLPEDVCRTVASLSVQGGIPPPSFLSLPNPPPPPPPTAATQHLVAPVNAVDLHEEPVPNALLSGESFGSSVSAQLQSVFQLGLDPDNGR